MTELVQFSTAESGAWREALRRFAPGDDIYFRPEYAAISEANGEGQAECLLVTEGASALLLPVLKQSIPGHPALCDVQSPYGYGGPLVVGAEAGFLGRAWRLIREIWLHDGEVAAFLRGHPLVANEGWFGPEWEVTFNRTTLAVDLRQGAVAAFAHPGARKHRRDTVQALRSGATVHFLPLEATALGRFRQLYSATMQRLGAGAEYFFSAAYFSALAAQFGDAASLVEVRESAEGETLSMALIFWGPQWAHYHLSGRHGEGGNASHLLLQAVAEEAARRNLDALHLGGGRTPAPEDSLLRFKHWIGNATHRFHTARLTVNRDAYNDLVAAWRAAHPEDMPTWFLAYRESPRSHPKPLIETS